MTFDNSRIINVGLVPVEKALPGNYIEIPVEKIVDGEVVVVDTKAVPIIPRKE